MKNTIIDFKNMVESVRKDGRQHDYKIDSIKVYNNYLYYKRKYIGDANFQFVEYFLFPKENIGIYKRHLAENPKSEPRYLYKYYVDMLKVEKYQFYWNSIDLYLDFIVKMDGRYYVVDVDEFNNAIKNQELEPEDINCGLSGLDNVLKGYYESFDMEKFIRKLSNKYENSNELIFESVKTD